MSGRYIALLRGINVGGRNKVLMRDLRSAIEAAGCDAVATYIQSGNVVLESDWPTDDVEARLEAALLARFDLPITVVARSHDQLRRIVRDAPDGFGSDPDTSLCDVIFLKDPLTPEQCVGLVTPRDGVDRIWAGTDVVYFERLAARRSQSRLSRIVGTPEYQCMTIRNWRTTSKLLSMADERD